MRQSPYRAIEILNRNPRQNVLFLIISTGFMIIIPACQQKHEARIYTAPKEESVFVVAPPRMPNQGMSGLQSLPAMRPNSIPLKEKRILGAIFPLHGYGYFLKITDTIDRIEAIKGPFHDVVAQFQSDPSTFTPSFPLPEGWTMGAGDTFADAKVSIVVPGSDKPAVMTVSKLNAPKSDEEWMEYLKLQVDRWNDQVGHGKQSIEEMLKELTPIERPGTKIPAYVFDRNGSHTEAVSSDLEKGSGSESFKDGSVTPNPSAPNAGMVDGNAAPPRLRYETPDGWKSMPSSAFRLATFQIGSESDSSEVVVSQALDAPLENCKMWAQQVLKTDDQTVVEPKAQHAVDTAESIPAGAAQAKLYRIVASDDPDANCLLIASIPVNDKGVSIFVKVRSTSRIAQEQNANLLRFVNSLRWE